MGERAALSRRGRLSRTSGVGEGVVPMMSQYFDSAQVSAGLRQDIIACWIMVSNPGGAAGVPVPPVDDFRKYSESLPGFLLFR